MVSIRVASPKRATHFRLQYVSSAYLDRCSCAFAVFYEMWAWVKIKQPRDRRFKSLVPFTRVAFWVPTLDPQPCVLSVICLRPACQPLWLATSSFSFCGFNQCGWRLLATRWLTYGRVSTPMVPFRGVGEFIERCSRGVRFGF